jgi:hypothetical protein
VTALVSLKTQCEVGGLILAQLDRPFNPVDGVGQQMLRFAHTRLVVQSARSVCFNVLLCQEKCCRGCCQRVSIFGHVFRHVIRDIFSIDAGASQRKILVTREHCLFHQPLPVPAGWQIAEGNADDIRVCAAHPWQSTYLLFANDHTYGTAACSSSMIGEFRLRLWRRREKFKFLPDAENREKMGRRLSYTGCTRCENNKWSH